MEIVEKLFRDYTSIGSIAAEPFLQTCLTVGRTMIFLVFTPIGILCVSRAGGQDAVYAKDKRKILTQLFGLFLIFCGISRGFAAIAPFHYFAWLDALFCLSAGITGAIALFYIPFVIRAINQDITLSKINETIKNTSEKLEEVKMLNKRHIKKDN